MKKIFSGETNPNHFLQPVLFGILIAVVLAVEAMPQARQLSPFAATAVAVSVGALACLLAHVRSVWATGNPGANVFVRVALAGALVAFGVFFILLGLSLQAHFLAVVVCVTLMPAVSVLSRKMFWGEALNKSQRAGTLLSLMCAGVWLMVDSASGFLGNPMLPASGSVFFSGNASVFAGALLLGTATSLARPADYGIPAAAYWSWVGIAAALVAVPTMALAQHFVFSGVLEEHSGLPHLASHSWKGIVILLLPSMLLGTALMCFRVVYLAGSSLGLSVGMSSCLWTFSALGTSALLAGTLRLDVPPLHLLTLPLHALGLFLARRTFSSVAPFSGLSNASEHRRVA